MRNFKSFLEEKTLTPAEKKKREEIAKAIERDNPDMPMAKKMAIATATAKKVAEEVEELEEYIRKNKFSKMTSTSKSNTKGVERFAIINDNDDIEVYNSNTKRLIRKVRMSNHQSAVQRLKKATYKSSLDTFKGYQMWYKSTEGGVRFSDVDRELEEAQGTAAKRVASDTQMGTITVTTDAQRKARAQAYRDKKAKEAMKKEEAEPVAEKNKGLWANIHAKRKRGEKPNPPGHPDRPTKADFKSAQKNEQIDELSKNTLGSYIGKAVDDMKKKKDQVSKGTLSMKDLRKGQNRNTMITKAQDKAHNK